MIKWSINKIDLTLNIIQLDVKKTFKAQLDENLVSLNRSGTVRIFE